MQVYWEAETHVDKVVLQMPNSSSVTPSALISRGGTVQLRRPHVFSVKVACRLLASFFLARARDASKPFSFRVIFEHQL